MTPPTWIDAAGRPRPTRACWTCGREVAPMLFRAGDPREFLKKQEGKAAAGEPIVLRQDRITYDEAAKDLRLHYATTGCREEAE